MENATAIPKPPSPTEQKDKFRRFTPPQRRLSSPVLTEESPQVPDDHHQSSEEGAHQPHENTDNAKGEAEQRDSPMETQEDSPKRAQEQITPKKEQEEATPPRGIWQWAKAGTGRLGIIGRIPHPEWKGPSTSKAADSTVSEVPEGGRMAAPQDDFSIPSATATNPENEEQQEENAAAKAEGLGITNTTVDPSLFSQTKRSSDDLVASANGTPSPEAMKTEQWTNGEDSMMSKESATSDKNSPPATPSPPQRRKESPSGAGSTPSPHRIPKYKIALAANILSPSRTASS